MRVNKARLAEIIGYTERTITTWLDEGLPRVSIGSRGQSDEYDTADVIRWMIARETGVKDQDGKTIVYEAERARLTREQADKVAMDNEIRRGKLVDVDQVSLWWGSIISNAKTRLLAIPTKSAPLVLGAKTLPQARDVLERMITEVLSELSSANPIPDTQGDAGVEAAAEADGEPVGGPAPEAKPRKQRRARTVAD